MLPPAFSERPHIPVLLDEVIAHLAVRKGGVYIDGTFGAGGYSSAILDAGAGKVIGIDRDPTAIAAGQALVERYQGRLELVHAPFSTLAEAARDLGDVAVDGIVLDIGVSSMQIDQPERGFSFRADGPLDMRMALSGESAADLVNAMAEEDLANLIYRYGEERRSRAIARAIVAERARAPITTTKALADLVSKIVYAKPGDIHPATRTFQALRIAVNDELGELERALDAAPTILREGGRLVVVTFHSLEDRIVKTWMAEKSGRTPSASRHMPATFREQPLFGALTRKPVEASPQEARDNPRSRSAKLRAVERLAGGRLS